jgi:hypothetical protein
MIDKSKKDTAENVNAKTELNVDELARVVGGFSDGSSGEPGSCGTKPPGWHPGPVHHI